MDIDASDLDRLITQDLTRWGKSGLSLTRSKREAMLGNSFNAAQLGAALDHRSNSLAQNSLAFAAREATDQSALLPPPPEISNVFEVRRESALAVDTRAGAAAVAWNSRLCLFGGIGCEVYSEVVELDFDLATQKATPNALFGRKAPAFATAQEFLLLHGGEGPEGAEDALVVFNLESGRSEQLRYAPAVRLSGRRRAHVAFTAAGSLFLLGGLDETDRLEPGLCELVLESGALKACGVAGPVLPPLAHQSCAAVLPDAATAEVLRRRGQRRQNNTMLSLGQSRMSIAEIGLQSRQRMDHGYRRERPAGERMRVYVFGGVGADGFSCNELRLYTFDRGWTAALLRPEGKQPPPRHLCGLVFFRAIKCLVLHGGVQRMPRQPARDLYLNDLFLLKPENCAWVRVRAEAVGLVERGNFSFAASEKSLIVFGGCNQNNLIDGCVTLLSVPASRAEQLATLFGRERQ